MTTHGSEWFGIPGYTELTLGYLSLYDLPPGVPRPPAHYFTTCEKILLDTAEPTVFNALIKHKFTHTCIRVVSQLNDCIGVLDAWLAVLARSKIALTGDNFDSKFFGRGVDLLLSSDHHFVVARTLVILYNYSWLFQGDARVEIYEHVVLGRHFYHLFLNWDENVRCIFYQLMLFKLMTCRKRDVLAYEAYLSSVKAAAGNSQLAGSNSGQAVKIQKPRFPKDISPTEVDVAMMHKIDICVGTVVAWKKSHPKEKQSQQSSYSGLVGSARKKTFIVEDPCENPGFADVAIKDDIECSPESHALTSSVVAAVSTSEKKAAENALGDIPPSRCVYVDKALKEYKRHTMRYDEWEAKGVVEIPNLVIVNFRN